MNLIRLKLNFVKIFRVFQKTFRIIWGNSRVIGNYFKWRNIFKDNHKFYR